MKILTRSIASVFLTLAFTSLVQAQSSNQLKPDTVDLLQAQERQLSRFSQEVFSRYVQLAYDRDLLEKEGSAYTIKGSVFALGGIFRDEFNELSTRQGTKFSRSFAIELGAKVGEEYRLSDGIVGFNWALIDHRNAFLYKESDASEIRKQLAGNLAGRKAQADFNAKVEALRSSKGEADARAMAQERFDAINPNINTTAEARAKALKAVYDKYNVTYASTYTIESVTEALKNRGLLTLYGRGYTDFKEALPTQSEIGFQYVKGFDTSLDNPSRWQFDIKSYLALRQDSTAEKRNLDRSSIISKVGVNRILIMNPDGKQSFMEAKFDIGNEFRTGNLFKDEDKNTFYGEASLRIRVSSQFWVPLTLKYDIDNATAFGFLKVVWNISPTADLTK